MERVLVSVTARQGIVLATLLVIVSLAFVLLDGRHKLDGPKSLLASATSPISRSLTNLGDRVRTRGDKSDLQAQYDDLQSKYDALLSENAQLKVQAQAAQQLRDQLNFQQQNPTLTLLPANVISRDPQSREKYIVIDRGSDDGLQVGMAVVSPNFLVGQITSVEPTRAKVLLVIDSGFQIGARLQNGGAEGIAYGQWQLGGRVVMRHIPVDANIDPATELVVTSNKTARVPQGLIIGKIDGEPSRDPLQNETEVKVLPLVDFDNLQTVTVITGMGQ
jgi:rod shape-determining protein MreC